MVPIPDGVHLTPVNLGGYDGERYAATQPSGIGQPVEGFVTDIRREQPGQLNSRGTILPPIPSDAKLQRDLEAAKTAQALADDVVTKSVEETGQVGEGLNALVEATKRVRQTKEALDPQLEANRVAQAAQSMRGSLDDEITRYRARNGDQNGPGILKYENPEVKAERAAKKTK